MSLIEFKRILFFCFLIALVAHVPFFQDDIGNTTNFKLFLIGYSLAIYAVQIFTVYWLLGAHRAWLLSPFTGRALLHGLLGIIAVLGLTTGLLTFMSRSSPVTSPINLYFSYLPIFLINTLPGALLEEWIFRYLPLRFSLKKKRRDFAILTCGACLVLFTLYHIPAYLLFLNLPLTKLYGVFLHGIFFFCVYLFTKNLPFTTLVHAQTNNPLQLVESQFFWLYFYPSVLLISCLWAFVNWKRKKSWNF
jgi:predicted Abi (CAAX) family protease